MTVKELIEQLSLFDKDEIVCVDGYEGGVSDLKDGDIKLIHVDLNVNVMWYYGDHDEVDDVTKPKRILIGR